MIIPHLQHREVLEIRPGRLGTSALCRLSPRAKRHQGGCANRAQNEIKTRSIAAQSGAAARPQTRRHRLSDDELVRAVMKGHRAMILVTVIALLH